VVIVFTSSLTLDSITRGTGTPIFVLGEIVCKVSFGVSCFSISLFFGGAAATGGLGFGLLAGLLAKGFCAGGFVAAVVDGFFCGGLIFVLEVSAGFFGGAGR
jgi:hypothetical protein